MNDREEGMWIKERRKGELHGSMKKSKENSYEEGSEGKRK